MQKLGILLLSFMLLSLVSYCQNEVGYKHFKVDVALGLGIPEGSGAKIGGVFALEPKYAVLDNLSVGLRLEAAVFARASITNSDGTVNEFEVKGSGSYLATGDYYITSRHSFRPFVGAGAGLHQLASATSSSGTIMRGGTKFGEMVRGGFESGHFRLGIEYNFVSTTKGATANGSGTVVPTDIHNNYWGFKVGVVFGGGRRG